MKSVLSYIFGWCIVVVTVVVGVKLYALNPSFYTTRYEKYDFAQTIDVNPEGLNEAITVLLDYLDDKRDDIVCTITYKGKTQEAFDQRETLHMVDVKNLYQKAIQVAIGFGGMGLIILFYFLAMNRKLCLSYLTKGYLRMCSTLAIALAFFGIWVATDFTSFWMWFHTLFFDNDLWLLDPDVSFMINMLPEIIFNQLVVSIALFLCIVLLPILIFSIVYQWRRAPIGFERKK